MTGKEMSTNELLDKFPWNSDFEDSDLQDAGLETWVGHIVLVGQIQGRLNYVQFDVPGKGGWRSYWPGWAYELAKDALLHGKKIAVVAEGQPIAANMVNVWIMRDDI